MTPKEAREILETAKTKNRTDYPLDYAVAIETSIEALELYDKLKDEMAKRNMTAEHIIEYMKFEDECVEKGFTFKSLIEAREKQIPKKPILKSGETLMHINKGDKPHEWKTEKWQDWVCPVCGWFVGQRYNASQAHPHDQRKSKFCNECGQAIDWSEEE